MQDAEFSISPQKNDHNVLNEPTTLETERRKRIEYVLASKYETMAIGVFTADSFSCGYMTYSV